MNIYIYTLKQKPGAGWVRVVVCWRAPCVLRRLYFLHKFRKATLLLFPCNTNTNTNNNTTRPRPPLILQWRSVQNTFLRMSLRSA